MKVFRLFLVGMMFLGSINIFAAEVENSSEQSTVVENSIDKTSMPGSAKDWDLNEREWSQYQKLMQGPAGLWYPQLSPPAVLGMHADNPEDKKHFAEIYARQEHQKVEQELAFNKAAFEAMQRLYKGEPMIKPFDITPFSPSLLAGK
jgi:integrating conjugative element protein (TIGR03759 family)